ncbi:hypothetical protein RGQ15_14625 [Paracoccus sp. MBLB3053]|uniref:Uncharacterized protein n=1 Tax=Paracoccus aurantius TaxID=3073814 RepID=A0ABU2HVN3_9RHOB|nr:hypothetical protein [Paracoccus sp. MBLB3053]MDS9468797.1 hypothetical protein [Paracoccus sp. MBLB3053]
MNDAVPRRTRGDDPFVLTGDLRIPAAGDTVVVLTKGIAAAAKRESGLVSAMEISLA